MLEDYLTEGQAEQGLGLARQRCLPKGEYRQRSVIACFCGVKLRMLIVLGSGAELYSSYGMHMYVWSVYMFFLLWH